MVFLTLRLPADLKKQIEVWAKKERRSTSQMAYLLLEKAVGARQKGEESHEKK